MSQIVHTVARLLALGNGRAVAIRGSYALACDPHASFAIVPLRLVAEQLVYAIAYGDPDGEPEVVFTPTPLDRDSRFLEPFAAALDAYLAATSAAEQLPRVWLPHSAALEVVELLGHRYRTNKNATAQVQRMGQLCRVLADETIHVGQQLVAVAADQLATHVVTGQSPSEDRHLGALLAWLNPEAATPVADAAAAAALEPAAAMLTREVDDRVEQLNVAVRAGALGREVATATIAPLLHTEVLREWRLLMRARRAFWSLGLEHTPLLQGLVDESYRRVAWRIQPLDGNTPGRGSIAVRLDEQVYAQELAEYVAVEGDHVARGEAVRAGKVIRAEVIERVQPRPGFHPCTICVVTDQDVLRVRRGTEMQLAGSNVAGRVETVVTDTANRTVLTLAILKGVRSAATISAGARTEWSDPAPADLRIPKRKVYKHMAATNDPRVYGSELPNSSPLPTGENLLAVARKLRTC